MAEYQKDSITVLLEIEGRPCQRKWGTFGKRANGHFRACSCILEDVEYRTRKESGAMTQGVANSWR